MRSLIILKGLVKSSKYSWVKRENLLNFYLDIEDVRKIFYKPEYKGTRDFLTRSYDETVYRVFMEALISRLSTGCLVVVNMEQDSTAVLEELALFFGYTVFYHVEKTPSDYVGKNRKYCEDCYLIPSKETLKKEVNNFKSVSYVGKNLIDTYEDVCLYFKNLLKPIGLKKSDTVLHISDLHSHHKIFKDVLEPIINQVSLTICLGDYIDGPEEGGSRNLIDMLLGYENPNVLFLEGNHEIRLRKWLAYLFFKGKGKRTLYETLEGYLPKDFENTEKEFGELTVLDTLKLIRKLNNKLLNFVIYEKAGITYYCTHSGVRWLEQLSPKFVGNVICSNKNPDRTDEYFSRKYSCQGMISIHGHCKYPEELNCFKYPGIINIDTEDEHKVNYFINETNKKFKVCVVKD